MRQYEVTFIVDPVLSGDEIKSTAKTYEKMLKDAKANIVHVDEMGLKPLAYTINKRNSGIYYCVEFQSENGAVIPDMELALRRDERIMRFLTISLDKFGVKYNEDKRNGLIGKKKPSKASKKGESKTVVSNDLTKIEGIGPKVQELFYGAGISTYSDLSRQSTSDIQTILEKGGSNFTSMDPGTWAQQAKLAEEGRWDELKSLQDELQGGKVAKSEEE